MRTIKEKIQKANENFDLTRSEIAKAMAAAKKHNRRHLCQFESWFAYGVDEWGYRKVECHFIDPLTDERLDDVILHCCLFDRRHSFITVNPN